MTRLPIHQLQAILQSGEASAEEVCSAYLERIEKIDGVLGAYISTQPERAIRQAQDVDKARASGRELGPLAGIPLAIKDVLCLKDSPATCGSRILESFVPPFDATAVERLRNAGAVFPGKANMDEFAMGSSNEYSAYHPAKNPWDIERAPGGSSGGSAAAVSAELAAGSLGTDTGGSVRQPAAFCGIVALKPTYGRVSRFGLVAFGSSLDVVGPITRCVKDSALLLNVIAGADNRDSTCLPAAVPDYTANLESSLPGLRVGVPKEVFTEGLDNQVRTAFENTTRMLEQLGAEIMAIELPHMRYSIPAYYIVACAEASSNLARYDGIRYGLRVPDYQDMRDQYRRTRNSGFGPEVKRRIMLGTFVLSSGYYDAYYLKGIQVRALIKSDFAKAFETVDLIATPTTPSPAFKLGEKVDDPIQMYLADIFTVTANLAGIPAISLNCGFSKERLPIGFQLLAPHLGEERLLHAAYKLEEALDLLQDGPPVDEEIL